MSARDLYTWVTNYWQPKWLYESAPYVYVVAGAVILMTMQNWMAFVSGVLFTGAGWLVFTWRRAWRS